MGESSVNGDHNGRWLHTSFLSIELGDRKRCVGSGKQASPNCTGDRCARTGTGGTLSGSTPTPGTCFSRGADLLGVGRAPQVPWLRSNDRRKPNRLGGYFA